MGDIGVLLADDDEGIRSLLAACIRETVGDLVVLEAQDGAEAVQVGLQRRPEIALLDVNMPRLDGIDVAVTLRELHPQLRVALQTVDPFAHRERAAECGLLLFDKLHLDRAVRWVELQARACAPPRLRLACSTCGYGVARSTPPDRCPMCQGEHAWIHVPLRAAALERAL